jgi:hypothetical protein
LLESSDTDSYSDDFPPDPLKSILPAFVGMRTAVFQPRCTALEMNSRRQTEPIC